jgi:hypothetical protein
MAAEALSETLRGLADRIDLYAALHAPGVTDVSGLLDEDVQVRSQDSVSDSPVARNGTRIRLTCGIEDSLPPRCAACTTCCPNRGGGFCGASLGTACTASF